MKTSLASAAAVLFFGALQLAGRESLSWPQVVLMVAFLAALSYALRSAHVGGDAPEAGKEER